MRIVKISDLSEEERKKALEQQQQRMEANRQESERLRQDAQKKFNETIAKKGPAKTSSTTTIGNLEKAFRNTENYEEFKKSLDDYYNKNKTKTSMWDNIVNLANDMGKVTENAWLGLIGGVQSFTQTIGRRSIEIQSDRLDFFNELDQKKNEILLQKQAENADKILNNNKLIPTKEELKQSYDKVNAKRQEVKEAQTEKISQNIEDISNPITKKLSEIAPSVGQMIPSFLPRSRCSLCNWFSNRTIL